MAPAPTTIHDLQATMGALEISTFVVILLFGFATAQIYIYFCNFPSDKRLLKWTIFIIWICDFTQIIFLCYYQNVATVIDFGQASAISKVSSLYTTSMVLPIIADRLVQLVLVHRIHKLLNSLAILVFFVTLIGGCLVGNIISVYRLFQVGGVLDDFQDSNVELMGSALVIEAFIDICLTVILCRWLRKGRQNAMDRTMWQIDTLFLWSIETGTMTSVMTLSTALCFFFVRNSYAWAGMWIGIPMVYTNSLLALLNGRVGLSGTTEYIACTLPLRSRRPPVARHSRISSISFAEFAPQQLESRATVAYTLSSEEPGPVPEIIIHPLQSKSSQVVKDNQEEDTTLTT